MSFKLFTLLALPMLAASSCAVMPHGERVVYDFDKNSKHYRLCADIPGGSIFEKHVRDHAGNLVRVFQYADGAQFIVACKDAANEPYIVLASLDKDMEAITQLTGQVGKGITADGKHYNRQLRDGFIVGYSEVPAARLEDFEYALHSAKVKR